MGTARVWDRSSTNYNQNRFVRNHGTNGFEVESEEQAMRLLTEAVHNDKIERLDMDLATGRISWVRTHPNGICECGECECDGGSCQDCDDCPGDDEDFGINDPRR